MTFLYDIINFEFVLVIYFLIVFYLRLDILRSFLVAGHLMAIFLLNNVLFEVSYWPDQIQYLKSAQQIRESIPYIPLSVIFERFGPRATMSSVVFAFSPLPFINSVQSIAMINFLFYLLAFFYLRKKGISSNSIDFFFLLYPSFLLYSSVALRETQILVFMILGLYFIIVEEKRIPALFFLLPLLILKIQNLFILVLAYIIYLFLRKGSFQRYLIFFGGGLFAVVFGNHIPLINVIFEKIDYYRWNLIAENFGYNWSFMEGYDYQPFVAGFSVIPLLIKSFVYMLLKPLPWEVTNLVQLIQSAENIFIIALIMWVVKKKIFMPIIKRKILFLNILLVLSMTIYGLVTFNFGTAARFRFPFIVVYLVFYLYLLRSDRIISRHISSVYSSTLALS